MPDSPQGTLKEGRGLACISKFAPTLKCLLASVLRWQEHYGSHTAEWGCPLWESLTGSAEEA